MPVNSMTTIDAKRTPSLHSPQGQLVIDRIFFLSALLSRGKAGGHIHRVRCSKLLSSSRPFLLQTISLVVWTPREPPNKSLPYRIPPLALLCYICESTAAGFVRVRAALFADRGGDGSERTSAVDAAGVRHRGNTTRERKGEEQTVSELELEGSPDDRVER